MKAFVAVLCLAVVANASWVGHDSHGWNAAAHIPSGSVSVSHDGAVIAGPAGSVHTDNGLHGHGAGARLSGPAGDVSTHGGHARLVGPGNEHHIGHVAHVAHVAPVAVVAPVVVGHGAWGNGAWGNGAWENGAWGNGAWGNGAWGGHGAWGGNGVWGGNGAWGHSAVVAHGLVGHGHHGW